MQLLYSDAQTSSQFQMQLEKGGCVYTTNIRALAHPPPTFCAVYSFYRAVVSLRRARSVAIYIYIALCARLHTRLRTVNRSNYFRINHLKLRLLGNTDTR